MSSHWDRMVQKDYQSAWHWRSRQSTTTKKRSKSNYKYVTWQALAPVEQYWDRSETLPSPGIGGERGQNWWKFAALKKASRCHNCQWLGEEQLTGKHIINKDETKLPLKKKKSSLSRGNFWEVCLPQSGTPATGTVWCFRYGHQVYNTVTAVWQIYGISRISDANHLDLTVRNIEGQKRHRANRDAGKMHGNY